MKCNIKVGDDVYDKYDDNLMGTVIYVGTLRASPLDLIIQHVEHNLLDDYVVVYENDTPNWDWAKDVYKLTKLHKALK